MPVVPVVLVRNIMLNFRFYLFSLQFGMVAYFAGMATVQLGYLTGAVPQVRDYVAQSCF